MTLSIRSGCLDAAGRHLLADIDFDLSPGKVTSVIGANGAGKTSLLRVLSADLSPSSGVVTLDREPLTAIPRSELARRLAVLPQHSVLDFPFTAREVIGMGRIPHFTGARADAVLISDVIRRLQLTTLEGRIYTTLSGGERQRVQIARVLCQVWDRLDGSYVLFDEPTAPLDLAHQLGFHGLTRRLAEMNAGVMWVIHDINLAARFSDVVALMKAGRIIAVGSPRDVITNDNMRVAFGVEVEISYAGDGTPLIYTRAAV